MTTSPAASRFSTDVRVRYADTDAAGVCYYANYLAFFEVARVELLRSLGLPIREAEARGLVFPCVDAHVRYLRAARLDDLLSVALWPAELKRSSFTFCYEVRRGAEVIATGETRHAGVDPATLRPRRLPDWFRALFEAIPSTEDNA